MSRMKRSEDEQAFSPKRKYMREGALSANSSTHIDDRSGIVENAKGEHSRSPRRNCEGIDRSERPAQHQEVVVIGLVDDDEPTEGEGITSETMLNGSDSVSVVGRVSSTTPHDDDARSDSSGEVTVIMDSADLASLSDAHKVICESRMRHFYEVFRHVGTSTVSAHNGLADEIRELCIIDDFQTGMLPVTDIGSERHNTVEGYSLVEVACYIRLERAQLPQMALLIVKPEQLSPSQLVARTLNEPVEIIFIMTALLARMYRWPIADDLDSNWQVIENVPPPNDEEWISSIDGIQAIFKEVAEDIGHNRFNGLRNNESYLSTITADFKNLCDEILKATAAVGKGLESLPSARTTTAPRIVPLRWKRRADRLQEAQSKRPSVEISLPEKDSQKIWNETSKILPVGEEISVVETRQSEFSRPGYMIVDDPTDLDEIPVSLREYLVRFTNSTEELSTDKFQKAFYSGIVAVGSHGYTNHEMLIFFDNGCDGMVAARTVHVLAEQQYTTCSDGRKIRERVERQQQKCVVMNPLQSRREARLMHNFEYAIPLHKNTIQEPPRTIHETRSDPDLCARGRALFNADESTDSDESIYQRRQTARKSSVLNVPIEDVSRLHHSASASDARSMRRLKDKKLVCHPISDWSHLRHSPHSSCSVDCLQELETDPHDKTFCGISPYMIPLMTGWKRSVSGFYLFSGICSSIRSFCPFYLATAFSFLNMEE
uniref:Uncharacterized protein n=1 Tax=Ascaris lumbricoides TaxID=6252 RepID=A0A9J2PPH0_ASCLU